LRAFKVSGSGTRRRYGFILVPCRYLPPLMPLFDSALAPDLTHVLARLSAAFPTALSVYAFGSRVTGTATTSSDLDLAVLLPGYAEPLALWDAAQALAGELGHAVDLLDLRAASTVMQHQVLTTGVRLWGDALAAGLFEAYVLSEKLALDAARAGLLADIAREGRIHAR
jgi:predicted nucleotidyltransferase